MLSSSASGSASGSPQGEQTNIIHNYSYSYASIYRSFSNQFDVDFLGQPTFDVEREVMYLALYNQPVWLNYDISGVPNRPPFLPHQKDIATCGIQEQKTGHC
jgi:hypothetical protein